MPYIKQDRREQLQDDTTQAETPGELNYLFSLISQDYVDNKGLSYSTINDIVGALEGAKLEFYRRVAVPYENQKIHDNGDVYDNPI